jgi:Holliday junction resolvase RusA-like endonuclease
MTTTHGRYLPEHPLDAAVRALGADAFPDQRLEVVWRAYEQENEIPLSRPPTVEQRARVHEWLQAMHGSENFPMFAARASHMRAMLNLSMCEKASRLAQSRCVSCELVVGPNEKIPLNVTFPIAAEPWSRQSANRAKEIRDAVHCELAERGICHPWSDSPICVTIVSLVPHATTRKDVDNLVKGLLDSMRGVLFPDDRLVQCLTSRRIEYAGPIGHYLVSARAVYPWDADVIRDDPAVPIIASGRRVSTRVS